MSRSWSSRISRADAGSQSRDPSAFNGTGGDRVAPTRVVGLLRFAAAHDRQKAEQHDWRELVHVIAPIVACEESWKHGHAHTTSIPAVIASSKRQVDVIPTRAFSWRAYGCAMAEETREENPGESLPPWSAQSSSLK